MQRKLHQLRSTRVKEKADAHVESVNDKQNLPIMIVGIDGISDVYGDLAFRPNVGAEIFPRLEGTASNVDADKIYTRLVILV
jgi:hypothetical protein